MQKEVLDLEAVEARADHNVVRVGEAVGVRKDHTAARVGKERKKGVSKQRGQGMWDLTQVQHTHHPSHPMITPSTLEVISPVLCYHYKLTFLALVIHYPEELADEPWNDDDDDYDSSPPPPIPFLIDIEIKAKVAQSNEDVKLWLSKV